MNKFFLKIKNKLSSFVFISLNKGKRLKKGKKIIEYTFCFVLPLSLAIVGGTLGVINLNKNKNENIEIHFTNGKINQRVYLLSSDDLSIPLSVEMEEKYTLQEQIVDTFNLLKEGSKIENNHVKGFVLKDTRLNHLELKDNVLSLDLSQYFIANTVSESKAIEALNLTFLSFDQIDKLKLTINDEDINKHLKTIKVDTLLTKDFGVNQVFNAPKDIILKSKQVIFYQREYDENTKYLVPITLYAETKSNQIETFVNATYTSLPHSSHLKNLDVYKGLNKIQEDKDNKIMVNENALIDETCVSKELFDMVSMSFDLMGLDYKVSFILGSEVLAVDGLLSSEEAMVNSIIFNSIEI